MLRYCARPPFALERLEAIDDDHLRYHLSKPQADGATELQVTPLELVDRIAALVPPPRVHRHRYHGVLAPNSPLRDQVTPLILETATAKPALASGSGKTDAPDPVSRSPARCASSTLSHYLSCHTHFARWMDDQQLSAEKLDEAVTARFLSQYLSRCRSLRPHWPLPAALKLLLALLRAKGVIAERMPAATPVEEGLRRFDAYMDHVRGLAAKTRSGHCCTVGRLLRERFGDQPIVISVIAPEELRRFVACHRRLPS